MTIEYSSHFKRSYRKLFLSIKKKAERAERIFRKNPFDTRIGTHKLSGKLKEYHSFAIDHSNRIVFKFIGNDVVLFLDVGDHDIYKRLR